MKHRMIKGDGARLVQLEADDGEVLDIDMAHLASNPHLLDGLSQTEAERLMPHALAFVGAELGERCALELERLFEAKKAEPTPKVQRFTSTKTDRQIFGNSLLPGELKHRR